MTVASAHRSPERVMRLVREAPGRGVKVFIVGAGAAAHLAGVVAAHTTMPVIGVPIDSSALKGLDALLSTVQMPPGVPVATVSIGKPGATNAGVLAAQILALGDPAIAARARAIQEEAGGESRTGARVAEPQASSQSADSLSRTAPMKYLRSSRSAAASTRRTRCASRRSLLARGGVPSPAARRRPRRRQHLLGDGDRRPGRAADDQAHRARQSRRAQSS